MSRFFGLHNSPGLVDLLTGTAAMEQTIVTREGLTLIPAGSKSQNPPDLLGSARMKALVEQLRETHDYVIIDTPPVGPVIDAKVTMQLADKVIFVVRWQVNQPRDGRRNRSMGSAPTASSPASRSAWSMKPKCRATGPIRIIRAHHYKNYYQN